MEKWPVRERENSGSQRRKCLRREGKSVLLKNADKPSKVQQKVNIGFCNLEIIVTFGQHSGEGKA